MTQLNQYQILGIASICFAGLAFLITTMRGNSNVQFLNMNGVSIGSFFIVGAIGCIAAACILSNESNESFGPSAKWFLPLGPYAMPGSNDCAGCKGCRTGHSQPAYAPDVPGNLNVL